MARPHICIEEVDEGSTGMAEVNLVVILVDFENAFDTVGKMREWHPGEDG